MIRFLSENWALLSFVVSAVAYIYYQVIAMRKGIRALLEDEYKQYHTLKGNGVGTQMYNALMALPTEPQHEREE